MAKKTHIYCEKKKQDLFNEIKAKKEFKGIDNLTLFCLAVVYGLKEKKHSDLLNINRKGFTRVEYVENNTDLHRLIESVAVSHEGDLKVLLDPKRVLEISETYANEGVVILHTSIFKNQHEPDFEKVIEGEVNKISKKLTK